MRDKERVPKELFGEAGLEIGDRTLNFIVTAGTPNIHDERAGWSYATSSIYLSKYLERSLEKHAEALLKAAKASEKHAASLKYATWALVGATLILAMITLIGFF